MKGHIAAVFDLDHTLTNVRSVESSFIRFLLQERYIGAMNIVRSAGFILRNIWLDPVKALKHNKMYLKGFTIEELKDLAQTFIEIHGTGLIPPKNRDLVHRHKKSGHLTILITGSPEFLVHPLMSLCCLTFDRIYATRLKIAEGCYTGEIEGLHYYGKEKEQLARTLSKELNFSSKDSYCYADSESDIPMMSLFGEPIAVNPDRELSRESLRSNWQIVTTTSH